MTEPVWFRFECLFDDADAADVLWELGAAGVEVQDHETFMEGGTIAPVPDGRVRLIAFFDVVERGESTVTDELVESLGESAHSFRFERFDDRSWETAWKDYFHPVRLSKRSMVGPPWEEFEAPDGGIKIVIEPGMAFGTGTHETTQIVATLLDERLADDPVDRLLDVGCGSAILSMLASGLGVGKVTGIDVDETAVGIAQETVEANGFGPIELSTTDVGQIEETFPIVLANILGHILLQIRSHLVDRTANDGLLLVSGVTLEQADGFHREFAGDELVLEERRDLGEWAAFVYRKRVS